MRTMHADVVVVGAGPAGAMTALAACRNNADVLILERKKKIGVPIQCAEFVPAPLIGDLDCNVESICAQKITEMRTFIDYRLRRQTAAPGFIINRDMFDQTLVCRAERNGAALLTSAKVIGLSEDSTLTIQSGANDVFKVKAKVIVAADGPLSQFRNWLGTDEQKMIPAMQMTFRLKTPTDKTKIYLSREIPGGYGWLFPKNDKAHVGLGMNPSIDGVSRITDAFNTFISRIRESTGIYGDPIASTAGWIPVQAMQNSVLGNVLFVGDAAGQTHPITGAGIFSAITCGEIAGRWAAQAAESNNMEILQKYDAEWRELLGRSLSRGHKKRTYMETNWQRFHEIVESSWIAFREYHG